MKKILIVTNIPNPYRIALFNEINQLFSKNNYKLKLVFGAPGYKRRLFTLNESEIEFEHEILKDKGRTLSDNSEKTYFLYSGLTRLMNRENPDVVIVAGFSTATMKVFKRNLFKNTPYIIYSGSIEKADRDFNLIRKIQRNVLAKHAAAFVVYGNLAAKYIMNTGVPENKIFIALNTVDTTFYEEQTALARNNKENSNNITRFLYLGYLVPRKNVIALLEAVKHLAKTRRDFILDIVGDGVSKQQLEDFSKENNLSDVVQFHGFRQREELPTFFAQSSAMLFQTDYDIWGLVLNEAMAAGLTCVASPNAGATHDLIDEGKTGIVVDFADTQKVTEIMNRIIDHPEEMEIIGKNAAEFIRNNVTLSHAADGFLKAVQFVLTSENKNS